MEAPQYHQTYRAGVIGHTGHGNYGHGLEICCSGLPGVEVVALADADEAGRVAAAQRAGAARAYADYGEMLARERLDVLAIAPYWFDQREAMVAAAARAGVRGIFCQKPFARSLDEADRMLAVCMHHGTRLTVAHQNRVFPAPRRVKELVAEGKIGRLRAIRAFGKQDHRGGGLDILILGTHMLDLMRFFAGDPRWCHARVTVEGRDATAADIRDPDYYCVGPVLGDDIVAQYGFDQGVTGTYESARGDDGGGVPYFRMELCGTAGILTFWSSPTSPLLFYPRPFALPDHAGEWESLPVESLLATTPAPEGTNAPHLNPANQLLIRDLLASLETGDKPLSSGDDARAALGMIMAALESGLSGNRVSLPLTETEHPLVRARRNA